MIRRLTALLGLAGIWIIDISNIVWLKCDQSNGGYICDMPMDNGFWTMHPQQAFHVGLYLAIIALVILLIYPRR